MIVKNYTYKAKRDELFTKLRMPELNVKVFTQIILPTEEHGRLKRKYFLVVNTQNAMMLTQLHDEGVNGRTLSFHDAFIDYVDKKFTAAYRSVIIPGENADEQLASIMLALMQNSEIFFFTSETNDVFSSRFSSNDSGISGLTSQWVQRGMESNFTLTETLHTGLYNAPDDADEYRDFVYNANLYPAEWMQSIYGVHPYVMHNKNEVVSSIRSILYGGNNLIR